VALEERQAAHLALADHKAAIPYLAPLPPQAVDTVAAATQPHQEVTAVLAAAVATTRRALFRAATATLQALRQVKATTVVLAKTQRQITMLVAAVARVRLATRMGKDMVAMAPCRQSLVRQ
jgi:hypothetical protein